MQLRRPAPITPGSKLARFLNSGPRVRRLRDLLDSGPGSGQAGVAPPRARGHAAPPSGARALQGTSLHLTDRVVPRVPVRQWVLSLPRWARFLLARDPRLITRALRLALNEIFKLHRRRARKTGARNSRPGAITFVQRFGSALNLNVHFHMVVPDGAFVREGSAVRFVPLSRPTADELGKVLDRTARRVTALLRPIRDAGRDDASPPDPLAESQAESIGSLGLRKHSTAPSKPHTAYTKGFSMHAGVHLHANDRQGLAQLCGYGARPPLSQARLSALPDGNLRLSLKRPLDDGREALTLAPVELLRRLASIVPPPRAHLVRFHGVFGPASRWRKEIVPTPPPVAPTCASEQPATAPASPSASESPPARPRRPDSRFPWAELLQRIFLIDVLACPCGGRRKITAFIKGREAVKAILAHLGLPTTGPPFAPTRSTGSSEPGWQDDVPAIQTSAL